MQVAGWLHQDAGNPQWAAYWTNRALGWARAADNPLMVSYVLMRMSNQASGLGDASRTLDLARAALRKQDRLSPHARALVFRQEARGHALSGDPAACAQHWRPLRSRRPHPRTTARTKARSPATARPSYIDGEAADCWMLLEQPRQAVAILEHGLSAWPAAYQRDRGLNLARLAVAAPPAGSPSRRAPSRRRRPRSSPTPGRRGQSPNSGGYLPSWPLA